LVLTSIAGRSKQKNGEENEENNNVDGLYLSFNQGLLSKTVREQ
jgi:hypothetical protein